MFFQISYLKACRFICFPVYAVYCFKGKSFIHILNFETYDGIYNERLMMYSDIEK